MIWDLASQGEVAFSSFQSGVQGSVLIFHNAGARESIIENILCMIKVEAPVAMPVFLSAPMVTHPVSCSQSQFGHNNQSSFENYDSWVDRALCDAVLCYSCTAGSESEVIPGGISTLR